MIEGLKNLQANNVVIKAAGSSVSSGAGGTIDSFHSGSVVEPQDSGKWAEYAGIFLQARLKKAELVIIPRVGPTSPGIGLFTVYPITTGSGFTDFDDHYEEARKPPVIVRAGKFARISVTLEQEEREWKEISNFAGLQIGARYNFIECPVSDVIFQYMMEYTFDFKN